MGYRVWPRVTRDHQVQKVAATGYNISNINCLYPRSRSAIALPLHAPPTPSYCGSINHLRLEHTVYHRETLWRRESHGALHPRTIARVSLDAELGVAAAVLSGAACKYGLTSMETRRVPVFCYLLTQHDDPPVGFAYDSRKRYTHHRQTPLRAVLTLMNPVCRPAQGI